MHSKEGQALLLEMAKYVAKYTMYGIGLTNTPGYLSMLWLNETPVDDISPLRECPLVSLTLHRTAVRDLTPLAGTRLQRLHIGETLVSDLSPLEGLALTRLIFSPKKITTGLDVARSIPTLTEIGVTLEQRMPPAEFWRRLDDGEFD